MDDDKLFFCIFAILDGSVLLFLFTRTFVEIIISSKKI